MKSLSELKEILDTMDDLLSIVGTSTDERSVKLAETTHGILKEMRLSSAYKVRDLLISNNRIIVQFGSVRTHSEIQLDVHYECADIVLCDIKGRLFSGKCGDLMMDIYGCGADFAGEFIYRHLSELDI